MSTSGDTPHDPFGEQPFGSFGQQPPAYGGQQGVATSVERNWAMAAHIGSFLAAWFALGLLAPLVVLLAKGDESQFIRRHAVESLNFQINAFVYTIVLALLIFVVIGIVLLPIYAIFYAICVILGTVRASSGEEFRYPMTVRVVS
ncbi:MAG: DUF4870 domain-containing protein [Nocardioidaceae bacterium]